MGINLTLFNFKPLISQGIKSLLEKKSNFKIQISEILFSEITKESLVGKKSDIFIIQFSINPYFLEQLVDIKKSVPKIKIIAIGEDYEEELVHALNYNFDVYLNFNISEEILLSAIENVSKNGMYIEPSSTHHYMNLLEPSLFGISKPKKLLTTREFEILILICKENTTKKIAEILSISCRTVDNHRKNLLIKTNSKSSLGLLVFAIKNKIFSI